MGLGLPLGEDGSKPYLGVLMEWVRTDSCGDDLGHRGRGLVMSGAAAASPEGRERNLLPLNLPSAEHRVPERRVVLIRRLARKEVAPSEF